MAGVLSLDRPIDTPDGLEYLHDVEAATSERQSDYDEFLSLVSTLSERYLISEPLIIHDISLLQLYWLQSYSPDIRALKEAQTRPWPQRYPAQ